MTRTLACALACAALALVPAGCGSSGGERPASAGDKATPTASPDREDGGKGGYGY